MSVITRFAPSPTGFLHIGGARTALFNYLFARHHGGKYLLRIEDTDHERSTKDAIDAIHEGLEWLGLAGDGEAISQSARADRHVEVAEHLLQSGHAYRCYLTAEELSNMRSEARQTGQKIISPWRDANPADAPDLPFTVRLKMPIEGSSTINDAVQGDVTVQHNTLDDLVMLRGDGTPTYMLAVMVDDHDMGVTHVIRGDDHLNNAFRQMKIIEAMGWPVPTYAHIPLIHGADGAKLSKRHGALSATAYRDMGYLPEAMCNYLLRLGWSHGDDEFFTDEQAKEWFDFGGINKSAARFDFKKLQNLSGQHIAAADDAALLQEILAYREKSDMAPLADEVEAGLGRALYCVKDRAKTFGELLDKAHFILVQRPLEIEEKAQKQLNSVSHSILETLTPQLHNVSWSREALEALVNQVAEAHEVGFGKVAGPLRAALAGQSVTPSVIDMMLVLGRDESVARLNDAKAQCHD